MTASKENSRTANGASSNAALSKKETEKAVRAIFRDHSRKLTKALLSPAFHRIMEDYIRQEIATLQALKQEARRKKPSKAYLAFCQHRAAEAVNGYIGNLATVTAEQLVVLRKMLDGIIRGMLGKPVRRLDPEGFVALQRKIFIQPKKRGPKFREELDEVLRLHRDKPLTEIARTEYLDAYRNDPVKVLQRLSKAKKRRERTRT
jgi:hypothetical protein